MLMLTPSVFSERTGRDEADMPAILDELNRAGLAWCDKKNGQWWIKETAVNAYLEAPPKEETT